MQNNIDTTKVKWDNKIDLNQVKLDNTPKAQNPIIKTTPQKEDDSFFGKVKDFGKLFVDETIDMLPTVDYRPFNTKPINESIKEAQIKAKTGNSFIDTAVETLTNTAIISRDLNPTAHVKTTAKVSDKKNKTIDYDTTKKISALHNPMSKTFTGMIGDLIGSETLSQMGKRTFNESDVEDYKSSVYKLVGDKYDIAFGDESEEGRVYLKPKGTNKEWEPVLNDIFDGTRDGEILARIEANLMPVAGEVAGDYGGVVAGIKVANTINKAIPTTPYTVPLKSLIYLTSAYAGSTVGSAGGNAVGNTAQLMTNDQGMSIDRFQNTIIEEATDTAIANLTIIGLFEGGKALYKGAKNISPISTVKTGKKDYLEKELYKVPDSGKEKWLGVTTNEREAKLKDIAKQNAQVEDIYKDFGGVMEQKEVLEMAGQNNPKEMLGDHYNHTQQRVNAEIENSIQLTKNFKTMFGLDDTTSANLYRLMRGGVQRVKAFHTSYYNQAQNLISKEMGDDVIRVASTTQAKLNELIEKANAPLNVSGKPLDSAQKSEFTKDYNDLLSLVKRDFTEDVEEIVGEQVIKTTQDTDTLTINGLFNVQKKFNAFTIKHKDKFTFNQLEELDEVKDAIYKDIYRAIDKKDLSDSIKSQLKELWSDANKGYKEYKTLFNKNDLYAKLLSKDEKFDIEKFSNDIFRKINEQDSQGFDLLYSLGKELRRANGDMDKFYTSLLDGFIKGGRYIDNPKSGEITKGLMEHINHQNKTVEIMNFDAFHEAFNKIGKERLEKIFSLTPKGKTILHHLTRFDEIAKREAVLQQNMITQEFKYGVSAQEQQKAGKMFYSMAYGVKFMLWESWAKYIKNSNAYEAFFLRALEKQRYEDIEPLFKKLDYDQRAVPPEKRVDINKLREELEEFKTISREATQQATMMENELGKSANKTDMEVLTQLKMIEYKPAVFTASQEGRVKTPFYDDRLQEKIDRSYGEKINPTPQDTTAIGNIEEKYTRSDVENFANETQNLKGISDTSLITIAEMRGKDISRNHMPNDWEALKKLGFVETKQNEFGETYEILSTKGEDALIKERDKRAMDYRNNSNVVNKDEQIKTLEQRIKRYEQTIAEEKANDELANDDIILNFQKSIDRDKKRLEELKNDYPVETVRRGDRFNIEDALKIPNVEVFKILGKKKVSGEGTFEKKVSHFSQTSGNTDFKVDFSDASFDKYFKIAMEMMPTFQGAKKEMATVVPQITKGMFKKEELSQIDTVWDYFGGGGSWGAFLSKIDLFPNLKELNIAEYSPARLDKIKFVHGHHKEIAEYYESREFHRIITDILVDEYKLGNAGSGTRIAQQLLNKVINENKDMSQIEIASLYNVMDYMVASFGKKEDASVVSRNIAKTTRGIGKAIDELKKRGIQINYHNMDSYAFDHPAGANVMAIMDPPYLKTKGYAYVDFDSGKVSDGGTVGMDIYTKTWKMIGELKNKGNSIIYTDEAYYKKSLFKDYVKEDEVVKEYNKNAFEMTEDIANKSDVFMEIPVDDRIETLSIIKSNKFKKGQVDDNTIRTTKNDTSDSNSGESGVDRRGTGDGNRGGKYSQLDNGVKEETSQTTQSYTRNDESPTKLDESPKENTQQIDFKEYADELNANPPSFEELKALDTLEADLNFSKNVFIPLRSGKANKVSAEEYYKAMQRHGDTEAFDKQVILNRYPLNTDTAQKLDEFWGYLKYEKEMGGGTIGVGDIINGQTFKAIRYDVKNGALRNKEYENKFYELMKGYEEFKQRVDSHWEDDIYDSQKYVENNGKKYKIQTSLKDDNGDTIAITKDGDIFINGEYNPLLEMSDYEHIIKKQSAKQESDVNFKKWFSGSKTVDEKGKPITLYHGSWKEFDGTLMPHGRNHEIDAIYLTDNIGTAENYSINLENYFEGIEEMGNPRIYPVYAKMENPLIIEQDIYTLEKFKDVMKKAKENGHDGVIIKNTPDDQGYRYIDKNGKTEIDGTIDWDTATEEMRTNVYIVFQPNQVKSVFNKGSWDTTNQDMLYLKGADNVLVGATAGIEEDENGNLTFDPVKFLIGMGGWQVAKSTAKYLNKTYDFTGKAKKSIEQFIEDAEEEMAKMAGGGKPPKDFIDNQGFYSVLEKTIDEKVGGKIDSVSLTKLLQNNGVKDDELEWSGLKELMENGDKLTKEQIEDVVKSNRLEIEVVEKANKKTFTYNEKVEIRDTLSFKKFNKPYDELNAEQKQIAENEMFEYVKKHNSKAINTKYQNYKINGGENYRELLFRMPIKRNEDIKLIDGGDGYWYAEKTPYDGTNVIKSAKNKKQLEYDLYEKNGYKNQHWDETNIIAFTRVDDRRIDNKKALFAEEIQSDWHQDRRSGKSVPNAPFKKNWHEFTLKRLIQEAVANDYDKIAWTTGKQQAERYNLQNTADTVVFNRQNGTLQVSNKGDEVMFKRVASEEELGGILGKEIANRLLDAKNTTRENIHVLRGDELKFGGEGMKAFYDEIVPNSAKKLFKKYGVKPKMEELDDIEEMVWSVDITEQMKEDIKKYGQPLYTVAGAGIVANETIGDENETN